MRIPRPNSFFWGGALLTWGGGYKGQSDALLLSVLAQAVQQHVGDCNAQGLTKGLVLKFCFRVSTQFLC